MREVSQNKISNAIQNRDISFASLTQYDKKKRQYDNVSSSLRAQQSNHITRQKRLNMTTTKMLITTKQWLKF